VIIQVMVTVETGRETALGTTGLTRAGVDAVLSAGYVGGFRAAAVIATVAIVVALLPGHRPLQAPPA
jgi:hypothetical protein